MVLKNCDFTTSVIISIRGIGQKVPLILFFVDVQLHHFLNFSAWLLPTRCQSKNNFISQTFCENHCYFFDQTFIDRFVGKYRRGTALFDSTIIQYRSAVYLANFFYFWLWRCDQSLSKNFNCRLNWSRGLQWTYLNDLFLSIEKLNRRKNEERLNFVFSPRQLLTVRNVPKNFSSLTSSLLYVGSISITFGNFWLS